MSVHPFVREPDSALGEIECGLLGILLYEPKSLENVVDLLRPEMFYWQAHQIIYEVISRHAKDGRAHTIQTIESHINDGLFATAREKREFLQDLLGRFVSSRQARDYARSIVEHYNKRRISHIASSLIPEHEKAEAMASLWGEIGRSQDADAISIGSILDKTLEDIDRRHKAGGGLTGLQTGLPDLDRLLCGLEPGNLYVLAGRPAMGKSAAGLTVAMNVACKQLPVTFFSLEMSAEQLAYRVNARYAGVDMWKQRVAGDVSFVDLIETRNSLSQVPFTIIDKSGLTADQICMKARELSAKIPQRLIVIDHLGIVAARDQRTPRVYQVGEMTMAFKCLAKELRAPVLLLHQLNRGVEGRDDKRPGLADLRDSGSIEQDADAVMMLYRKEYYLENREPTTPLEMAKWQTAMEEARGIADLIIVKNRQGKTGTVKLRFDGDRQCFEGLASGNYGRP
jgi:replicative DNA helicase